MTPDVGVYKNKCRHTVSMRLTFGDGLDRTEEREDEAALGSFLALVGRLVASLTGYGKDYIGASVQETDTKTYPSGHHALSGQLPTDHQKCPRKYAWFNWVSEIQSHRLIRSLIYL